MNNSRLENIFREMGGSDYKRETEITIALSFLPLLVVIHMSDKELAEYCHNVSFALRESWLRGNRAK